MKDWLILAFLVILFFSATQGDLVWTVANGFALLYLQNERANEREQVAR